MSNAPMHFLSIQVLIHYLYFKNTIRLKYALMLIFNYLSTYLVIIQIQVDLHLVYKIIRMYRCRFLDGFADFLVSG